MGKIGIVIDSTVYLSQELIDDNNIGVASLNVINGVDSYKELDIDNKFVWDMQDKGAHWKTSQPSPGEFLEIFERMISEGYDKIFCVLLSKNISGTYQSALLAKKMLGDSTKVHLFDTMLCAYGTAMITLELIEMVNENKTEEVIVERITRIIGTSVQMFSVQNLFSLVKGGRLSVARATIGTVLRIKPIIKVIDGKLQLVKSERTHKKIFRYFMEHINKSLIDHKKITFYVLSQHSLETAKQVRELFEEEYPGCKIIFSEYLGPVFSIHVGKKGYGISYFVE
ncbi:DegV domain-containing protein [Candidatus Izimaplasma bacterium HR1]|jgi:DegV family protein with EDD domain|uniref:DegV family protein n=1 Tax=Candidatus Izimoplasma sp. HR1 TaxID=1541959 RepID=UPI0004F7B9FD|nr:DegV domain-containing protein [Candidatus Izimaplasma bacterium HR1]